MAPVKGQISVFGGKGFVLGEFCRRYKGQVIVQEREDFCPHSNEILYGISTVHNYHVFDDPTLDIKTNLLLLVQTLENARLKFGEDAIFNFVSSWFVYGEVMLPATEESACSPRGFYSITKRAAEQLLVSYCETFHMKYRILRLPNVLGAADKKVSKQKNYTQYLIKQLLNNEPVQIYYGGRFYRDYIDVRDCARAMKMALESGALDTVYNISNGNPVQFSELVKFLIAMTHTKSAVSYIDKVDFHEKVQTKSMYMSGAKLARLGYKPKNDIWETLAGIVNEYRSSIKIA